MDAIVMKEEEKKPNVLLRISKLARYTPSLFICTLSPQDIPVFTSYTLSCTKDIFLFKVTVAW